MLSCVKHVPNEPVEESRCVPVVNDDEECPDATLLEQWLMVGAHSKCGELCMRG